MSKVYYYHTTKLKPVKRKQVPASTIALKKVGDKFYYGISICSRQDNFSKKFGRETAELRMNSGFGILDVPKAFSDLSDHEACIAQLCNLAASTVLKNRKWKKKITKFNQEQRLYTTKIVPYGSTTA
jgi:hypothetical protein